MIGVRTLQNYFSLALIQASNAVLPIIAFPVILTKFGSEEYARIVVTEALSLLAVSIVLYSFDLVGVRAIIQSDDKTNKSWLSALFFDVLVTRLFIFAIIAGILLLGVCFVRQDLLPYALGWLLVPLSYAVQPNWFFQAHERNMPLALISFVTRASLLVYILMLMPDTIAPQWIPTIIGSSFISGAVAAMLYCVVIYELKPTFPTFSQIWNYIRSGKEICLSNFSVSFFRDSNVIIMGALSLSPDLIALYSLTEKFIKVVQASCRPLNQLFYPRVMRVAKSFPYPSSAYLRALFPLIFPQLMVLVVIWAVVISAALLIFDPALLELSLEEYWLLVSAMTLMALATLFGICNFMLGAAGLNAVGYKKTFLVLVLGTGVMSLTANVLLIVLLGFWGAAIGFVLSEGILLFLIFFVFLNNSWFEKISDKVG